MNKNHNQPLSSNDIESIKVVGDLRSIASVTLNELNDVTGGQIVEPGGIGGPRRVRLPLGNTGGVHTDPFPPERNTDGFYTDPFPPFILLPPPVFLCDVTSLFLGIR